MNLQDGFVDKLRGFLSQNKLKTLGRSSSSSSSSFLVVSFFRDKRASGQDCLCGSLTSLDLELAKHRVARRSRSKLCTETLHRIFLPTCSLWKL